MHTLAVPAQEPASKKSFIGTGSGPNKRRLYPIGRVRQSSVNKYLRLRARIIEAVRRFFIERGYLEVETPIRIPAPAPELHIDAPASGEWFLHTSPELCMKRLLAEGHPRLFQICKCFRQGERGDRHLPEFTMLEWYTAKTDYLDLMDQCEDLIRFVARHTGFEASIPYHLPEGKRFTIDLKKPWGRMTVAAAFERYASMPMEEALCRDTFDEVMAYEIEPRLGCNKPLFLYDYPAERGALARLKPDDESLSERFELYMAGLELCNGFTELTDPNEQRERFEKERDGRRSSGKATCPLPEKFLESLRWMPNASGNALGIDRLVMIFADTTTIDKVVAFTPEAL
jgi:lysyl-tRNA synthetase class 2